MPLDFKDTFFAIEKSLLEYGTQRMSIEEIHAALSEYKSYHERDLTDDLCFEILVDVAFYSGFKAATVSKYRPVIQRHFANFREVANYDQGDIDRILADKQMLRNQRKIEACVANAKVISQIINDHGSFLKYIESFNPRESFENVLLLKEELQGRFSYLAEITVYHFLTDLGLPVLKPDRVICRLFRRLGLVEFDGQYLKTVILGRKFATATGLPIRYIDMILVAFGQVASPAFGVDRGICIKNPRCELCGLTDRCVEFRERERSISEDAG